MTLAMLRDSDRQRVWDHYAAHLTPEDMYYMAMGVRRELVFIDPTSPLDPPHVYPVRITRTGRHQYELIANNYAYSVDIRRK